LKSVVSNMYLTVFAIIQSSPVNFGALPFSALSASARYRSTIIASNCDTVRLSASASFLSLALLSGLILNVT
jgi:hypothetical protein